MVPVHIQTTTHHLLRLQIFNTKYKKKQKTSYLFKKYEVFSYLKESKKTN